MSRIIRTIFRRTTRTSDDLFYVAHGKAVAVS
jgi:hypothetical protein